ncbi:MAG: photosystem assembly protein Ycf3 [Dehalococcoidia bacterium]|nr:photosystem assembly protein Ycf3 [Dehalococcoidia bacterium]
MATTGILCITFASGPIILRTPRGDLRQTELPHWPSDEEFSLDIACLALDTDSSGVSDEVKQRLVEHLAQGGDKTGIARRLGKRLFGLLFSSQEFIDAYRLARDASEGLRLVLEFALKPQEPDPVVSRWAALPWEYLLDPSVPERGEFLALRPHFTMLRRLSGGGGARPATVSAPLKVLATLAEPWDQLRYGREEAMRSLEEGLSGGQVEVRLEREPTFPALIRALGEDKPHVVHVVAHGSYHPQGGGALALENEYGGTNHVQAQEFARQLAGSGVRLVVLGACLSGAGDVAGASQGTAQALLRAGVPAVVAMQYSVPVITAHRFSKELYRALSRGTPLDEAVGIARRVLSGDRSLPSLDWAIPVLYVQGDPWSLARDEQRRATSPAVERAGPPGNLPSASHLRPTELVGRGDDMVRLATALREPLERRRFVTATGIGGIGKTAATVESAFWHWDRDYFPDGVFWVSAKEVPYTQLLSAVGAALGIQEFDRVSQQVQEQVVLEHLERRRLLLVVDNVDGLRDDGSFRHLLSSISPSPAGRLLLTCRRRLNLDGEEEVLLLRLALGPAVFLFSRHWGLKALTDAQMRDVTAICGPELLDGHPLAIEIAASLARKERLSDLTSLQQRLWVNMARTLDDPRTPGEERSIVATLNTSYDALGSTAGAILTRLSVFEAPPREDGVEAMAGDIADWRQGLTELLEHHLLDRGEATADDGATLDVFTMHSVVRGYAMGKVEDAAPLHQRAGRFLAGSRYAQEVVEAWQEVMEAAQRIENYLDIRGMWSQDELVLQAALGAARALGNREREGWVLGELGSNHLRMGDARGAIDYYQQALAISREIGDRRGEGTALGNLGNAYGDLGEHETALKYLVQSLGILGEIESPDAKTVGRNIARLRESIGEGQFRALLEKVVGEPGTTDSPGV